MAAPFTLRLDEKIVGALDELAARTEQSRDQLVERAIADFVALQTWQVARIEEGIAAAEVGDFVEEEELQRLRAKYALT